MIKENDQATSTRFAKWFLPALMPMFAAQAGTGESLRSETFKTDGMEIHYRTGGSGPHLLFLHGITLSETLWEPFLAEFMQQYTVISVDLPGHGKSSHGGKPFDYGRSAEAVLGLLDHLGARRAYAIGHSAGGITLLRMHALDSERLGAMVMVDVPHRLEPEGLALLRSETYESLDADMLAFYRAIQPYGDEQIKWVHDETVRITNNPEDVSFSPGQLANVNTPTLVVWGDRDQYLPAHLALELYQSLPQAELWIVPGQGHCPIFESMGGSAEAAWIFPSTVHRFFSTHRIGRTAGTQ